MRLLLAIAIGISAAGVAVADSVKTEVVEETLKTETRMFCSKTNGKDARKKCQAWLNQQKTTLGDRLLTSYCPEGELKSNAPNCLYRSVGEIKFVLKTFRTETTVK